MPTIRLIGSMILLSLSCSFGVLRASPENLEATLELVDRLDGLDVAERKMFMAERELARRSHEALGRLVIYLETAVLPFIPDEGTPERKALAEAIANRKESVTPIVGEVHGRAVLWYRGVKFDDAFIRRIEGLESLFAAHRYQGPGVLDLVENHLRPSERFVKSEKSFTTLGGTERHVAKKLTSFVTIFEGLVANGHAVLEGLTSEFLLEADSEIPLDWNDKEAVKRSIRKASVPTLGFDDLLSTEEIREVVPPSEDPFVKATMRRLLEIEKENASTKGDEPREKLLNDMLKLIEESEGLATVERRLNESERAGIISKRVRDVLMSPIRARTLENQRRRLAKNLRR